MAAPAFQAVGSGAAGAGAQVVPWPAHAAGDIAFLVVEADAADTIALSVPSGFVEIPNSALSGAVAGSASTLAVFWCRATSSSMTSPVLAAVTDHQGAVIVTYRGCVATGDPWDAIVTDVNNVPSTSVSAPGVTTSVADTCIVSIISRGVDTIVAQFSAWGNGATERFDLGTNVGNGGGFGVADYAYTGPGTTTATGATLNNASATCAYTIALTAVLPVVHGSTTVTLDNATAVATARVRVAGSVTATLDAAIATATAASQVKGTTAVTLDDAVGTATASSSITAVVSALLDDAIGTALGTVTALTTGVVSEVLADAVGISTATVLASGAVTATLEDTQGAATGASLITAGVTAILDDALCTGLGRALIQALVTAQLDDATATARGGASTFVVRTLLEAVRPDSWLDGPVVRPNTAALIAARMDGGIAVAERPAASPIVAERP